MQETNKISSWQWETKFKFMKCNIQYFYLQLAYLKTMLQADIKPSTHLHISTYVAIIHMNEMWALTNWQRH